MKELKKIKAIKSNNSPKPDSKKVQEKSGIVGLNNPYYDKVVKLKAKIDHWDDFFSEKAKELRPEYWNILDDIGQTLSEKYAWAIPDEKSLKVLKHFSPLIEIGAGKGYWAKLLQNRGVDIVAFDKFTGGKSPDNYTKVQSGGPEVLLDKKHANRNLFLCYPDEAESIAIVCLENFTGEYIIHVGELMTNMTGTMNGAPVAPFGRTSSAEFQTTLAASFHCLLIANLSLRFPYSKDCISVWKRTNYVAGKYFPGDHQSDEDEEQEDEDDDVSDDGDDADDISEDAKEGAVGFMSMADLAKLRGETVPASDSSKKKTTKVKTEDETTTSSNKKKSKSAGGATSTSSDAVEFIDMETLRQLRGESSGAGASSSASSSKSNQKKNQKQEESEEEDEADDGSEDEDGDPYDSEEDDDGSVFTEEEDPYAHLTEIERMREMALDAQYNEDQDNKWANIPAEEMLPVDRAAPCLAHLLK